MASENGSCTFTACWCTTSSCKCQRFDHIQTDRGAHGRFFRTQSRLPSWSAGKRTETVKPQTYFATLLSMTSSRHLWDGLEPDNRFGWWIFMETSVGSSSATHRAPCPENSCKNTDNTMKQTDVCLYFAFTKLICLTFTTCIFTNGHSTHISAVELHAACLTGLSYLLSSSSACSGSVS